MKIIATICFLLALKKFAEQFSQVKFFWLVLKLNFISNVLFSVQSVTGKTGNVIILSNKLIVWLQDTAIIVFKKSASSVTLPRQLRCLVSYAGVAKLVVIFQIFLWFLKIDHQSQEFLQ